MGRGEGVKGIRDFGSGRLLCAAPSMHKYFYTVNILRLSCAKRAIVFLRVCIGIHLLLE